MNKFYFLSLFFLTLTFLFTGCSSDDDVSGLNEHYLTADVNGIAFNSDQNSTSLRFSRNITPSGSVNLLVKASSADGDIIEFLIENFNGPGKYYIGNSYYNSNWIKFERPSSAEVWMLHPKGALYSSSNFIEITANEDEFIEGKFSCDQLKNSLDDFYGFMDGEFRMNAIR